MKTIGKHVNNLFKEGDLDKEAVAAKFATTATDGKTYKLEYYNIDVIISIGYRVKSKQGTQFRKSILHLKEYFVKGFALNYDRFKSGSSMNYFNE